MAYLESVWDLVKQKQYDEAWKQANSSMVDIMGQISAQNWQQGAYKMQAEVMGVEAAREAFFVDMTLEVGSILYAMGEICYKEGKFDMSYTYLFASHLLNWGSSGVEPLLKKALKQVKDKAASEVQAARISNPWKSLGLGSGS